MELKYGKIELNIKDFGKIIWQMDLEFYQN